MEIIAMGARHVPAANKQRYLSSVAAQLLPLLHKQRSITDEDVSRATMFAVSRFGVCWRRTTCAGCVRALPPDDIDLLIHRASLNWAHGPYLCGGNRKLAEANRALAEENNKLAEENRKLRALCAELRQCDPDQSQQQ